MRAVRRSACPAEAEVGEGAVAVGPIYHQGWSNTRRGETNMVANNSISAVLVSTDLETCRGFYEDKVGLKLSPGTIKNHLLFDCGNGTTLLIYGRGASNKADHTQVRFWSADIDADVAELVDRGIEFEEYDMDAFKTINYVVTSAGVGRSAWFKDPDRNTIALFQPE